MFILKDEKLVKKINDYDKGFKNNNDYVFACIEGGLKKRNTIIMWLIIFIIVVAIHQITNDTVFTSAIIGGLIGLSASLSNDFCVITVDEKHLNFYIFNKLMSKVVNKIELPYMDTKIDGIKKTSIWNTIKIKTKERNIKIVVSKKTAGLKNQTENTAKFLQKLDSIIFEEKEAALSSFQS